MCVTYQYMFCGEMNFVMHIKVAYSPVVLRSTNLESKLIEFFVFVAYSLSWESQTVPHFLSALASNNQFIITLVKMWPGGTLHVLVGTLKISLD